MVRFVACCFLLSVATIDGNAQQSTASSVSADSTYFYSSRGIGFKKGNGGFDVFQIQGGDQLGVIKAGGGHIQFKKMEGVTPEQEQAVNDAIHDYQMGRVSPAAQGFGANKPIGDAPVAGGLIQQTASNPPVGSKASSGYVITSFTQTKSLTEIHVKPSSAIPAAETVIKFDTGRKGSVLGLMAGGALAGQGGTMNNSHMDVVWINGKTNTGTNKGTAINFAAYKAVMDCIHEYVDAGHAPSDFDSKRLERFDKAMEYKAQ
jgi:hypothetical protein